MASNRSRRAPARVSSTSSAPAVVKDMVQLRSGTYKGRNRVSPFEELGTSGLRQWSGWIYDEWLQELQGRDKAWRWREVLDNSPLIGGFLFLIETLAKQVTWTVTDGSAEWQEHVHQCMDDMSRPWGDFLSEALTFLPYGYAPMEEVFKRRLGDRPRSFNELGEDAPEDTEEDPRTPASSKYTDGKIGWRKLPLRAQETTLHWDFDGYSKLRGLIQLDWHGGEHFIPITKMTLFRFRPVRGNPEGTSILRKAWTSHVRLSILQDLESLGAARDLAGIPVLKPPEGFDIFAEQNAAIYEKAKQLVTAIHRDEDEGVVLPDGWELTLLNSGGSRQFDINEIIRRHEQRLAASVLSDFMLLGQDGLGSYAMVDVKSEIFGTAVNAVLDMLCETMNRVSVPRLLALNGVRGADLPQIKHGSASRVDLEKIGSLLYNLSAAGAPMGKLLEDNPEALKQLFETAGVPIEFSARSLKEAQAEGAAAPQATPNKAPIEKADGDTDDAVPFVKAQAPEEETEAQREEREAREAAERLSLTTGIAAPLATTAGTALLVGPLLGAQAATLAVQLEGEILAALGLMGGALATAYLAFTAKNPGRWLERKQLANRVLAAFNLRGWLDKHLEPLVRNQASRALSDTARVLGSATGNQVNVDDAVYRKLVREGMQGLRKSNLEPQIRKALNRILEEAFAAGDDPEATARKIKQLVPAGRFTNLGPEYRAKFIAREITAEMQRTVSLAAYRQMENCVAIRLRDGVYGPPRSDRFCIDRDGKIVRLDEVPGPAHVRCTLGYEPVMRDTLA